MCGREMGKPVPPEKKVDRMAGRPKKPTALKVLEGNPGKRPLLGNEPHPRVAGVTCPSFLGKTAKTEWGRSRPVTPARFH
mgnify:CR=1 FL=1